MRTRACRRKYSVLAYCSLVLASVMPLSSVVHAEEEVVASTVHGGNPYLIVSNTPDSPAGRQGPGIYVRQKDADNQLSNNWVLALPGHVLPVPVRGGLYKQFEISNHTTRFEAATVIDGVLNLFTVNTTPNDPSAVARIGSGAFSVIDPVDGTAVQLPPILRSEDITMYSTIEYMEDLGATDDDSEDDGGDEDDSDEDGNQRNSQRNNQRNNRAADTTDDVQVVVCSIKGVSPKGTGVTFAFALRSSQNRGARIVAASPPVLLSWQFEDHADVARYLRRAHVTRANAPSYWRSLVRPRPGDAVAITNWRTKLNEELANFERPGPLDDPEAVPYIDLTTGSVGIEGLPVDTILEAQINLMAVFDPLFGRTGIYAEYPSSTSDTNFQYPGLENQTPLMVGLPICDEDGCVVIDQDKLLRENIIITKMRDGRIALFASLGGTGFVQMLRPGNYRLMHSQLHDVSWYVVPGTSFIIVSWDTDQGAQTVAFNIEVRPEGFALLGSVVLADRMYYSAPELASRVHVRALTSSSQNKSVLFDNYTTLSSQSSDSAAQRNQRFRPQDYKEAHSFSMPHIDMGATLADPGRSIQVVFPDPKSTTDFSRQIQYRVYDAPAGYTSQTGLYTKGRDPELISLLKIAPLSVEQISPRLTPEHVTNGILDRVVLDDLDKHPIVDLSVVSNNTYFYLISEIEGGSTKPQVESMIRHTTYPLSDANGERQIPLQYIRLYRLDGFARTSPEDKKELYKAKFPVPFMLVYAEQNGNTYIHTFELTKKLNSNEQHGGQGSGPVFERTNTNIRTLATTVLELPVIESRLRFSHKGDAYYVNTPDLEPEHPNYALVRLSNWEKVYPNRMSTRATFYTYSQRQKPMPVLPERSNGGAWRVWPTDTRFAEVIKKIQNSSEYQVDLIPQLRDLLEDLANPNKPPRRVVLNVPNEMRTLVENLIHYIRNTREHKGFWSDSNTALRLYSTNNVNLDQPETIAALVSLRSEASDPTIRPVLLTTASYLADRGSPRLVEVDGVESGFQLEASTIVGVTSADSSNEMSGISDNFSSTQMTQVPTLTYLMATEGRKLQPIEFRDSLPQPTYSTLIVGTPTENGVVFARNSIEGAYGLSSAFESVTLDAPSRAHREGRLIQLFSRPEIQAIGFRFNAEGLLSSELLASHTDAETQAMALQALATYLVNKAETLSNRHGMSTHSGFNRVMNTLLVELMQTRPSTSAHRWEFSRASIENVLSRVFPMALNINLLPENDPLRILYRHNEGQQPGEEAAFQWTLAGYFSDKKLKMDVIRIILNQLSADEGRNVSSSFILMGGTGSGKTSLVTSLLFDVLKLKTFKFGLGADASTASINKDAQVFFLEMSKVIDDRNFQRAATDGAPANDHGSITLTDALAELDRFLATPLGYRGFIVLDDLHLAPPAVRSRFISRLRSFQDSQTYSVMGPHKKMVEYPTRNLIPIITINPTENRERIAKFASNSSRPTDVELILATLSAPDGTADIDPSFLSRFSRVIKVENFPPEAKAPKLSLTTRTMARDILENDGRFVAVSQAAIELIANKFPNMNAREFISSATRALTAQARNAVGTAFVVVPRTSEDGRTPLESIRSRFAAVGSEGAAEIEAFADENFTVLSLSSPRDFRARLGLLSYVAANGRVNLLRTLLLSMYDDRQFSGTAMSMRHWLAPLAQAMNDHITQLPRLNMQDMQISPLDLGITRDEDRRALSRSIIAASSATNVGFQLPFLGQARLENVAASFLGREPVEYGRTRQDLMRETVTELTPVVEELLNAVFQTNAVAAAARNPQAWLQDLGIDKRDYVKDFGSKLMGTLVKFSRDMRDLSRRQDQTELTEYETMRLFIVALDLAYARQPWGHVLKLVEGAVGALTQNIALAQTPGVQKFLFESNRSPLVAQDAGALRMIASSVPYYDQAPEADVRNRFPARCAELLKPQTGSR